MKKRRFLHGSIGASALITTRRCASEKMGVGSTCPSPFLPSKTEEEISSAPPRLRVTSRSSGGMNRNARSCLIANAPLDPPPNMPADLKDEFLATLSHELRTPLNAILGWSQLLGMNPDKSDLEQGLDAIQRNARAQTQLIEDLLDMSRIISGKVRLDVQWTDLAGVIDAAVDAVRPAAEAKEHSASQNPRSARRSRFWRSDTAAAGRLEFAYECD